jgi:hypothetical protein
MEDKRNMEPDRQSRKKKEQEKRRKRGTGASPSLDYLR